MRLPLSAALCLAEPRARQGNACAAESTHTWTGHGHLHVGGSGGAKSTSSAISCSPVDSPKTYSTQPRSGSSFAKVAYSSLSLSCWKSHPPYLLSPNSSVILVLKLWIVCFIGVPMPIEALLSSCLPLPVTCLTAHPLRLLARSSSICDADSSRRFPATHQRIASVWTSSATLNLVWVGTPLSMPSFSTYQQSVDRFSDVLDLGTATQALLPSWPQPPSQSYALEPIAPIGRPSGSRPTAPQPLRSSQAERQAPYPPSRPLRHEMIDMPASRAFAAPRSEREMYAVSSEQPSHLQHHHLQQQHVHNAYAQPRTATPTSNTTYTRPSTHQASQPHSQQSTSSSSSQTQSTREAQHKVYLLNCKHCGNFLSDRGMKAVLLLKPNITLYSTDIVPTTCGPYFGPSSFHGQMDTNEPPVERTCECLTQSLGCYGCGAQVGYNIISPCLRCTNSVMKHQRSSNGHRTVLHCSEITVRERRYVPGEPGVRAAVAPIAPAARASNVTSPAQVYLDQYSRPVRSEVYRHSNASQRDLYLFSHGNQGHFDYSAGDDDELEAEKLDATITTNTFYHNPPQAYPRASQHPAPPQHAQVSHASSSSPSHGDGGRSSDSSRRPRTLRRGDTIFWSDLVAGGERAQPFDPDPILERPIVGR
ncbi:hypothetical protein BCV70DRAFT_229463 [Testicularia cyperi]|uniref:Uncharacterized protein n=1 Tax=Testicularia cyperi TaxID=1882483 RepID=A0A317XXV9_9BASI|nr:hypothetical protein BCV70DRAFT_229463 [Testicularia cyperi]